jgi:hypothetical protein
MGDNDHVVARAISCQIQLTGREQNLTRCVRESPTKSRTCANTTKVMTEWMGMVNREIGVSIQLMG